MRVGYVEVASTPKSIPMTAFFAMGMVLLQTASVNVPAADAALGVSRQDSTGLTRLRARIDGQAVIRVQVGPDHLELDRPRFLDTAIAYRNAWSDSLAGRDTSLANPLPLSRVSVIQLRGRQIWPSVLGGSLSIGVSALASMLLTKAVNSNSGIDGNEILRVTLIAFGAGAAVGAVDGVVRTRWVVVWRGASNRTDGDVQDVQGDGHLRSDRQPKDR